MTPSNNPHASDPSHIAEKVVICPTCGGDSVYALTNPHRPFCSARCKNVDLGAWASEEFRMPTDAPPDDTPFGDPRLQ
ncbi:MAG: DNA gyrase inhibitor YacG [Rhodoferax sp.]|nr:DNA gyrase inhibitor YacG [Rhodoferax sp.]MCF8209393.1 DNA gyrase inhibitor YacG [Rhodoferax sp.]